MDTQEVCQLLGISKRTLQNYKDRNLLPYSYINRKNYYKRSDVLHLLENQTAKTEI
ncbi:helix-turn-helix domain-containing protein [Riemerella anatipestifer]|uniref:helix-turn-helix domain-containing protein n=1 Tax=Riemerella anatipestifer TaxID=34085 RepID=UPI003F744A94